MLCSDVTIWYDIYKPDEKVMYTGKIVLSFEPARSLTAIGKIIHADGGIDLGDNEYIPFSRVKLMRGGRFDIDGNPCNSAYTGKTTKLGS